MIEAPDACIALDVVAPVVAMVPDVVPPRTVAPPVEVVPVAALAVVPVAAPPVEPPPMLAAEAPKTAFGFGSAT